MLLLVCLQEIHRLQDSADQANKHASFFERESQRLEVRVKDLSQQVEKTLLLLNVLFAVGVFMCCCVADVWKLHSATVMETLAVLSTLVTLKLLLRIVWHFCFQNWNKLSWIEMVLL